MVEDEDVDAPKAPDEEDEEGSSEVDGQLVGERAQVCLEQQGSVAHGDCGCGRGNSQRLCGRSKLN